MTVATFYWLALHIMFLICGIIVLIAESIQKNKKRKKKREEVLKWFGLL